MQQQVIDAQANGPKQPPFYSVLNFPGQDRRFRLSSTLTGLSSSRAIVVKAASSSPQAVIHSVNGAGSRSTLSA